MFVSAAPVPALVQEARRAQGALLRRSGMCLFYKRLDRGTFRLPEPMDEQATTVEFNERELDELLDGIDVEAKPRRAAPCAARSDAGRIAGENSGRRPSPRASWRAKGSPASGASLSSTRAFEAIRPPRLRDGATLTCARTSKPSSPGSSSSMSSSVHSAVCSPPRWGMPYARKTRSCACSTTVASSWRTIALSARCVALQMLRQRARRVTLAIYGRKDQVRVVEAVARWYGVPERPLKVVAVQPLTDGRPEQAFYSTRPEQTAEQVLIEYSERWSIEKLRNPFGVRHTPGDPRSSALGQVFTCSSDSPDTTPTPGVLSSP